MYNEKLKSMGFPIQPHLYIIVLYMCMRAFVGGQEFASHTKHRHCPQKAKNYERKE